MKIAYDYQAFCIKVYGGITRYYVRLAEQLLAENEDVCVFAPLHRNNYLASLSHDNVKGLKLHYPLKLIGLSLYCNSVLARQLIRGWQPELVHETYYSYIPSGPKECPTVLTVFDMIHELYPHEFKLNDYTSDKKRVAIERADHIICISECTRNDLIHFLGVPEEKISVVHLGFDHFKTISNVKSNSLEPSFLEFGENFILYVGDRGGYKNFSAFIQCVGNSERLKRDFNIIAFGGGAFTIDEQQLIHSLGLKKSQVRQVNGSDDALAQLYDRATAFVFPSLYEGFGLPPLEAMAHECPVISSNSSCLPEIIGNGAEFFDPYSTEEMSRAIENVVYSNERIATLKSLGQKRIKQFSWEKCAHETLEVYRKVMNEK